MQNHLHAHLQFESSGQPIVDVTSLKKSLETTWYSEEILTFWVLEVAVYTM